MSYKKQKTAVKPKSAITAKLYAVWYLMAKHGFLRDESEKALNAYARKMINTKNRRVLILNVGALDNYDASRLVEMLKKWHKRLMVAELEKQGNQVDKKAGYNSILEYYEETIFNA
ncbi:TPA: phage protein GemA/Gp16 family protein [Pasteurella multocida]